MGWVGWVGLYGRYGDVGVFVNMCVYVCFVRMCGAGVCVYVSVIIVILYSFIIGTYAAYILLLCSDVALYKTITIAMTTTLMVYWEPA